MAHFAQLDVANIVVEVIVVNNEAIDNLPFPQSEPVGIAFCQSLCGASTIWKQTSYNASFRKNYAHVGGIYNLSLDAFINPSPLPSWVLNEQTCQWEPPIPYPTAYGLYEWDEPTISWASIPKPYPSWILNDAGSKWIAPVPKPNDGKKYVWDEATLSWVEVPGQ